MNTEPSSTEQREVDHLRYKGNQVPRVIRLAWTIMGVFFVAYMLMYALPDLIHWLEKLR